MVRPADVVLVSMPWCSLCFPSIQLGILTSLLEEAEISAEPASLNLRFLDYLHNGPASTRLSVAEYEWLGHFARCGLGEWLFAVPPFRSALGASETAQYRGLLRSHFGSDLDGHGDFGQWFAKLEAIRAVVPRFLEEEAQALLAHRPRVIGFTSTFSQNVPSLVLAKVVRQTAPDVKIVFGGSNCRGIMGETMHRLFPWIDVVVRGESEGLAATLFRELVADRPITPQPGLCWREKGGIRMVTEDCELSVPLTRVPAPKYDEFFERLGKSPLKDDIQVSLAYESSRGCWWGAKHKCTFCGRKRATDNFRSKPADQVFAEMTDLARRYKRFEFEFVDDILDMAYFSDLLPRLAAEGIDFVPFFETKANLRRRHVRLLTLGGVRKIQAGIESLSTPLLKAMRKGTTALVNIRLLKWCLEEDLHVIWNLLFGFPGEEPAEYDHMADLCLSLTHLQPPVSQWGRVRVDRFSVYHENARDFGLILLGPSLVFQYLYEAERADLNDLVCWFDHLFSDGRDPEAYIKGCRESLDLWQRNYPRNRGQLFSRRGPGFMEVYERRSNMPNRCYVFDDVQARIYEACDAGATPQSIWLGLDERDRQYGSVESIRRFLDELTSNRICYREDDRYLSLAVPFREGSPK